MAKNIKKDNTDNKENDTTKETDINMIKSVSPNDPEWTDHVLGMLNDDEKIGGNPTTDGLRRIFELALNCVVTQATSDVVQTPEPNNEKRATVVHTISYVLKDLDPTHDDFKHRSVSGAADVYWGNCDKVYRNHPVAVAETRAEGRALRRALKLRKVVAAEEIVENIEDHPDQNSVSKITNNQINFIDVIAKRLNINVTGLLKNNNLESANIYSLSHEDAVKIIRLLSSYQQDMESISSDIIGYNTEWK
jgi:hypothetical protein